MTSNLPATPSHHMPALLQRMRARFIHQGDDIVDAAFVEIGRAPARMGFEVASTADALLPPLYQAGRKQVGSGQPVEGAAALVAILSSAAGRLTQPLRDRVASFHAGKAERSYNLYAAGMKQIETILADVGNGRITPDVAGATTKRVSEGVTRYANDAIRHGQKSGDHEWVKSFTDTAKQQSAKVAEIAKQLLPESATKSIQEMAKKIGEVIGNVMRAAASGLRMRR